MAHEVESMFYVGATPWHGLGVAVPEDKKLSIAEAIVAAGLDWEVKLRGLFTKDDRGAHVPVLDHYVTFRNADNAVLGVVGKDYQPLQNLDAFKWFQPFLEGGQATIETAGSLRGGAKVWVLARIRRDPLVVGKEDVMKHYVLLSNSHDGSLAVRVGFTPIRVVCNNTLCLALKTGSKKDVFKQAHQGGYEDLEARVAAFFAETLKAVEEVEMRFKAMLDRKFDDDLIKAYIGSLFPLPAKPAKFDTSSMVARLYTARVKKVKEARFTTAGLMNAGKGTDLPGVKGSLWGALNAVLEYADHYGGNGGSAISSGLFGSGAMLKRRAFELALTYLYL